jgi:hypothetical protein
MKAATRATARRRSRLPSPGKLDSSTPRLLDTSVSRGTAHVSGRPFATHSAKRECLARVGNISLGLLYACIRGSRRRVRERPSALLKPLLSLSPSPPPPNVPCPPTPSRAPWTLSGRSRGGRRGASAGLRRRRAWEGERPFIVNFGMLIVVNKATRMLLRLRRAEPRGGDRE